ncbi:MAG: pseudaminic acid cytidylyltransferase [Campylobacterales bacterium]|nr:pseudaminic acid cytidylyltransferase [Campylobacterales bacterium]
MKIAIIPARGGSKRIPRKNIKPFFGKPMIAYSIEAARACALFDRIVVSTDNEEIADTAKSLGAEVPFMRPQALSNDHTPTIPVIAHAIEALEAEHAQAVCCIYATAPFLRPNDLREAYRKLINAQKSYCFPVVDFGFPIQRSVRLDETGNVEMFWPEHFAIRSQDLPKAYHDVGQFYWGRAGAWLEGKPIFAPHSTAIIIPRYLDHDLDTPEDWERAELFFKALR